MRIRQNTWENLINDKKLHTTCYIKISYEIIYSALLEKEKTKTYSWWKFIFKIFINPPLTESFVQPNFNANWLMLLVNFRNFFFSGTCTVLILCIHTPIPKSLVRSEAACVKWIYDNSLKFSLTWSIALFYYFRL